MARVNIDDDQSKNDPYDEMLRQSVMQELDPTAQQTPTQTPPPAFSGGGGPPQPQDPYYSAYKAEHPDFQPSVSPVGTQLNYDNSALPNTPPTPPSPSPGTQTQPPSISPAPAPGPATTPGTVTPPQGMSQLPPQLTQLLQQLTSGLTNFQVPTVSQPSQVTPAYSELIRNAIMSAIQEGQQPVNESDPMVAPIINALRGQSQRSKEVNQGRVAEQLAAHHLLNSGAYDTSIERYNQGADEATANSQAQVMTQVLNDRKQRLMQAIQLGANYLTADQARQLQAELANVNSALGQYQAKGSIGLSLLQSLLSNQLGYDQLGLQAGEFSQLQNNNAVGF